MNKYISRNFIVRLSLLFVLIASAALFDLYHQTNSTTEKNTAKTPAQSENENKVFYCSQVPAFNLKTLGSENQFRVRFSMNQDKFILKYYNLRTFRMMKTETSLALTSTVRDFHSLPFRRTLYQNPDDTPPLS